MPAAAQATPNDLSTVVEEVLASRRYRWLAPDFVARIAASHVASARRIPDAVKNTKRALHQAAGAYAGELRAGAAVEALNEAAGRAGADSAVFRQVCVRFMALHASTAERIAVLDSFYARIFDVTGAPSLLLDTACGLNPLTVPWMGLPCSTTYAGTDIDARYVEIGNSALRAAGVAGSVRLADAAKPPNSTGPIHMSDGPSVALLLKTLPCIERQERGAAKRLLMGVTARYAVVSYPTRSLGGAAKGMPGQYRAQITALIDGEPWQLRSELTFPLELVFVLERSAG